MAPEVYRYVRDTREAAGWKTSDIQYSPEVALELGRKQPAPWFAKLVMPFLPKRSLEKIRRMTAYVLFTPA